MADAYDQQEQKLVTELIELHDHWLTALSPRFREMVGDHKLYLGYREDRRQAHEKWRSWSWLGDPYSLTTTETDAWMEIMNSTDPSYSVEGVGTEDEWKARAIEREIDYILRGNKWTYNQEMLLRNLSIQGWKVIKTGYREIKFSPMRRPTKDELIAFDTAVNQALASGQVTSPPDPESQPEEFAGWMESTKAVFPTFPDAPGPKPSDTVQYRGPWMFRPSEFDLRFDPYIEDWTEHEVFFQRVVKPRSWGEKQVEAGKFDKDKFAKGSRSGPEDKRLSQYDRDIAAQIGLTFDDGDPIYRTSDEYLEVWRPYHPTEPYQVILNRSCFINVNKSNPFWHGQLPYICVRNIPLERRAFGLGSYSQLRRTFHDRLTFRDILLDGLLLSVMPVFLKSRNMGQPEMQRFLQPGAILEVNDPQGFRRGWESMPGFAELMKVGEMLLGDQTTLTSTGENVKGQPSQVGRVSATESQSRLTQALTRHKKKAERLESEMSGIFPQMLYNLYQYLPEEDATLTAIRAALIGEDEIDPLRAPEFSRETFAESLAMNVRFRGATSKLNKELMAQQLQMFLQTASQIQSMSGLPVPIMTPQEARTVMSRMFDALGQKGGAEIFTAAGDQAVQSMLGAHMIAAQTAPIAAQGQLVNAQMQLQQMMAPPPQIDPATGQPVQQEVDPATGQPVQPQAPPQGQEPMMEDQGVEASQEAYQG